MFITQVQRDGMLILMLMAPLLAGIFFRFGLPLIEFRLTAYFGLDMIISPYYRLFDLFLCALTSYMISFIATMTMLDEYDHHLVEHLVITPLKKSGYLHARVSIPLFFTWLISIAVVLVFALESWSFLILVVTCMLLSFMSLIFSLIVFSFSKNKVEGLAIAKVAGLILSGLIIPFFIFDFTQYYFSFLPSYWIARYALDQQVIHLFYSIISISVWLLILFRRFNHKLSS
jgi:fluoroquinolone transport system permease protein